MSWTWRKVALYLGLGPADAYAGDHRTVPGYLTVGGSMLGTAVGFMLGSAIIGHWYGTVLGIFAALFAVELTSVVVAHLRGERRQHPSPD